MMANNLKNRIFLKIQQTVLLLFFCFMSCDTVESNAVDNTTVLNTEQQRTEFNQDMKTYNFWFSYNKSPVTVSPLVAKDASSRKVYNIQTFLENDSTKIRFRVTSMGCLEFIGNAQVSQDTILLKYKNISSSPCECCQEYELEFVLPTKNYPQEKILLNDKFITLQKD